MRVAIVFVVVVFAIMQSVYSFKLASGLKRGLARSSFFSMMAPAATLTSPLKLTGKTAGQQLLEKTDCFIFDCDGVIWKGVSVNTLQ